MAMNMNKFKNLPMYVQVIVAALPSVVLVALFIIFIFMPKKKEMEILKGKVHQLDMEIASSEEKIKRLDKLIAENEILKKRLATLKEQLPEEKEVSVLLKQVSELGLMAGLEIMLWKPEAKATDPSGLYVEIPVKVEVLAEYHKLGDFLSSISRLPRLVNISDISLLTSNQGRQAASGIIKATFMARTFASVTKQEMAQPGAVKGK
jgi:type IV pilus assembly protein PilO